MNYHNLSNINLFHMPLKSKQAVFFQTGTHFTYKLGKSPLKSSLTQEFACYFKYGSLQKLFLIFI